MNKEDLIKELKKLGWSMPNLGLQAKIVGFPIMWFGDYDSYITSKKRIVTIAINPSEVEFKENRFVKYDPNNHSNASYIRALNEYFKNKPYTQWFKHYEDALNGMEASYGGEMSVGNYSNTALHIDYDAPIATAPTWASLLNDDRNKLHKHYSVFFKELVSFLNPDVILVSLATEKLTSIVNEFNFKHVETLLKSNLSDLAISKIFNSDGGKRVLIAGRNYGTPMSSLTKSERQSICNHAVNGGKLPNNITSSNNDYPKIGTCLSQSSHKKPCTKSINYPNSQ